MQLPLFLARFFSIKNMLTQNFPRGSLPTDRQVYKRAFLIAWPAALESSLVALISTVDTMMVGGLGPEAISAVGICSQPRMLMLALIISLNMGVTAVIARRKGADDRLGANVCLKQAILYSTLISFLTCSLAYIYAEPLVKLAGAGPEFADMAVVYLRNICSGTFFYSICLTINAAQRGIGNTKLALKTNMTANLVNIIFNYLLINGNFGFPRLEVRGAAIATSIGNVVAFLMAIYSIMPRKTYIHIRFPGKWRPDKDMGKSLYKVSSSGLVEQLFIRLGMLLFTRIVASLGVVDYASHVIAMNLYGITYNLCDGFGVGAAALVGQSLGAMRKDLAMIYGWVSQRIALIFSLSAAIIIYLARGPIVHIFSQSPGVLEVTSRILLILIIISVVQTVQVVLSSSLRGAGDTSYVAKQALVGLGIMRPLSAYIFTYCLGFGVIGAWLGILADQGIRSLLLIKRFNDSKWTEIQL